jgi:hypothetical protein
MFIAKRQMTLDDGTVSRLTQPQVDAFNALDTLDERIAAARANPEIGRQFLSTVERTSEAFVGIRKIIIGDKDIRDEEAKAARIVTGLEKGQKAYDALIESIVTNTPLTQAANRQEAVRQVARIRDPAAAFEGQIIEEFNKTLKEVNLTGIDVFRQLEADTAIAVATANKMPVGPVVVDFLNQLQSQAKSAGIPVGAAPTRDERERLQQAIDAINDLIVLQRQAQQNQQPPAPVRVQVQAPAVRPKEAPLPAETAP